MESLRDNIYFKSRPEHIRSAVMHSGAVFQNEQQLRQFCEDLLKK